MKKSKPVALVSGATGFIGSHLHRKLLGEGFLIRIISSSPRSYKVQSPGEPVQWFDYEKASLIRATEGIDYFFNFSVVYDRPDITDEVINKVNVDNPLAIVKLLGESARPVSCVIGDSFFRKYPINATRQPRYTASKNALAEQLMICCEQYQELRVCLLQIEQVYGVGESLHKVYPSIIRKMLDNISRIALTDGLQRRDFIDVDDVVDAIELAARKSPTGLTIVECGSGHSMPVREVFVLLKQLTSSRSILGFGDILKDQSIEDSKANTAWLNSHGWSPRVSIVEGLLRLVEDVKKRAQQS